MNSKAENRNATPQWRRVKAALLCASLLFAFASTSTAGPVIDGMDFTGANLDGTDYTFGIITDSTFVDATLLGAIFDHTLVSDSDFTRAIFDGADLTFADFSDSTFVDATFTGATLDDSFFSQSDFTDAVIDGATFKRATVRGGTFDGADLSGTDFTDTQFRCINDSDDDEISTDCPSFIDTNFTTANLTSVLIAPQFSIDELILSGADFQGANLSDAIFAAVAEPCLLVDEPTNAWQCMTWGNEPAPVPSTTVDGFTAQNDSDLRGTDMRNLAITGSAFDDVLLAGVRLEGATITDADFIGSNATCLTLAGDDDASNSEKNNEEDLCDYFEDNFPVGSEADFRDATLDGVDFTGAMLSNATFGDADLDTDGASLTEVDFTDATLAGTDFTDAIFTQVVLNGADLGCDNNPGSDPADFDDECGDCANFTRVFGGEVAPTGDVYNIEMQSLEFDDYLMCSALSVLAGGEPLIADLSFVKLDGSSFTGADVTAVDFEGASVVNGRFNEAIITGVNFDGADLTLAQFNDITTTCLPAGGGCATFVGTNFSFAGMSDGVFNSVNFDDAIFDGAIVMNSKFGDVTFGDDDADGEGTSFVGANLSASGLNRATFTNADLTDVEAGCDGSDCASFVDVTFTDSDLTNADFRFANLSGVQFVNSDLSGATFANAEFSATTSLGASQIDGLDLSDVDLTFSPKDLFISTPPFDFDVAEGEGPEDAQGVRLSDADLTSFDFTNVELRNWDLSDATIDGAIFTGAVLEGATLTEIDFSAVFAGLTVDSDFFMGTDLRSVDLRGLTLSGMDFSDADLSGALVTTTDFSSADFTGANLSSLLGICESVVSCADITNATLTCANLAGTTVTDFAFGVGTELFQNVDSDLSGVKLPAQTFDGYNFSGTNLTGANLENTNLTQANFTDVNLAGALLRGVSICTSGSPGACATFRNTDLVGSTDCDMREAADFSNVSFADAPLDLFEDDISMVDAIADDSVACVNFTGADMSLDAANNKGFNFDDLTDPSNPADWDGAVLAGANLTFQEFDESGVGEQYEDFFLQLGHAAEHDDICTSDDDDVDPITPGPDLRETIFNCTDLTGQKMSAIATPSDLQDASFIRATVGGPGSEFSGANMEGVDFSNVLFAASTPADLFQDIATFIPEGETEPFVDENDVPYPNLRDTNFAFVDFSITANFELQHVDLTGAVLSGANFDGADLTDALLDNLTLFCGVQAADVCGTAAGTELDCPSVVGAKLAGVSLRGVDLTELFSDTSVGAPAGDFFQGIDGGDLSGVDFTDAAIAGMNFSNMILLDTQIADVQRLCDTSIIPGEDGCANFEKAMLGGSDSAAPLSFLSTDVGGFDFRTANLAGAVITNALLTSVDFSDIGDLCVMTDCLTIRGKNTSLLAADFRDLDLSTANFGEDPGDVDLDAANRVIDFRNAIFRRAIMFSDLKRRDFTSADFRAADLSDVDLDDAIIANITTGCDDIDGLEFCTTFDRASMCGVDARGANIEGSFENVDAADMPCGNAANFSGASFEDISLATTDFTNAILEGVDFDTSVELCDGTDCVILDGASLTGVIMRDIGFDSTPDRFFENIADQDLSEADFTGGDLSDKFFANTKFNFADLSGTDLRRADLRNAVFDGTEFARGGSTSGRNCDLGSGGSRVDLRGADIRGADLSRAVNFQRGCIRVNSTTLYDHNTKFPNGFDLIDSITIPEPSLALLQGAALLTLVGLVRARRRVRPSRPSVNR